MMNLKELYWTAGFIEGDGNFLWTNSQCRISAVQCHKEPLEKLQQLWGGKVYARKQHYPEKWNQSWRWELNSSNSAALAMTLYPLMSTKRQKQIQKMLESWKAASHKRLGTETHCPWGHERLHFQRVRKSGQKYCSECGRLRMRAWRDKENKGEGT